MSAAAFERGTAAGDPDAPAYFGAMLGSSALLAGQRGRGHRSGADHLDLRPGSGFNDHVYVAVDAMFSAALGDVEFGRGGVGRLSGLGIERAGPHSVSNWLTTPCS